MEYYLVIPYDSEAWHRLTEKNKHHAWLANLKLCEIYYNNCCHEIGQQIAHNVWVYDQENDHPYNKHASNVQSNPDHW